VGHLNINNRFRTGSFREKATKGLRKLTLLILAIPARIRSIG
jgi:hypothetical protein